MKLTTKLLYALRANFFNWRIVAKIMCRLFLDGEVTRASMIFFPAADAFIRKYADSRLQNLRFMRREDEIMQERLRRKTLSSPRRRLLLVNSELGAKEGRVSVLKDGVWRPYKIWGNLDAAKAFFAKIERQQEEEEKARIEYEAEVHRELDEEILRYKDTLDYEEPNI